jgi:sugar transferase (PEP-CTERM/EpsH1 system associated)
VVVVPINRTLARIRAVPHLLTRAPLTKPCFYSKELDNRVGRSILNRSYDRIFVYCSAMAQYVDSVTGIPIITDFVDVDSDKWRQYAAYARFPMSLVYRRESRCLRAYERQLCALSSSIIVTTEREADLVRQMCVHADVHVITNGVDTDYFSPAAVKPAGVSPTILFTGDMSYFPNEDAVVSFAREVLPIVREQIPEVRFFIVGRNPSPKVQRLHGRFGVYVSGYVPDVRDYLAQAHVSVAPFRIAAGIQNKILEAMAYGLPVVATPRAAQGLSASVAEVIHKAESPCDMAAALCNLLRDSHRAHRWGIDGRTRVSSDYNWDRSVERLLALIQDATSTGTMMPNIAAPASA